MEDKELVKMFNPT